MYKYFLTSSTVNSSEGTLTEEATKTVNAFTKFWDSIDWDGLIASFISKGIVILIAIVIILSAKKIGLTLIRRGFNNYRTKESYSTNRIETLHRLTSNTFQYFLYFILLYTILTVVGVPVGSLIAGAGIAGIAIGLGAQGFINDFLTGFFIILERQIDVGNFVKIDGIEGTVQSVGLRTTKIKSLDGTLHFIPNRNISIISNLSRENMQALIKIRLKPDTDFADIHQIIEKVNAELVPKYPEIQSGPDNLGLSDLGNGQVAIKISIYTLNGAQYKVQADFLSAYLKAITAAGNDVPDSPLILK